MRTSRLRDLLVSSCVCGFVVAHQRVDTGLVIAEHVGRAHPEWLFTPDELERLRLVQQTARRRN